MTPPARCLSSPTRWIALPLPCLVLFPVVLSANPLTDLRPLARPQVGTHFLINTFSGKDELTQQGDTTVIANVGGPGIIDHLTFGQVGEITLTVDGMEVLRCAPREAWLTTYPDPEPEERGDLPWAFPLVQVAGPYAHCALPIPFRQRLVVTATNKQAKAWIAGRLLDLAPEVAFSDAPDSPYVKGLAEVLSAFERPRETLLNYPNSEDLDLRCHCPAGDTEVLCDLAGPSEVVGLQLRMQPGAMELLRHQVIEIALDGTVSLRMPLVDFVGVSHPWHHAWQPMAGDRVAGIVHPYERSGGRIQPAVTLYWKLPISFAKRLRISLRNRSKRLPVTFEGTLRTVPLRDPNEAGRLCGTSVRLDLAPEGTTDLFAFPGEGNLVGLSAFTSGHGLDWEWRRRSELQLVAGDEIVAAGPGLLPLGMQGLTGNLCYASESWNHNSLEVTGRAGAGRHCWRDPLPVTSTTRLRYLASGKDGPTRAEVGVVWYQFPGQPAYGAPPIPDEVEVLPPPLHPQPGLPTGSWKAEAEDLAASAEATAGEVRAETENAKDAFASGDAYLAWNADQPGDVLDVWAPLPTSRYARVWIHRLLFRSGGIFRIGLAGPDDTEQRAQLGKSGKDITASSWGQVADRASMDFCQVWPHRQAYRIAMPIMRNPAPGKRGRVRFTCLSKRLDSRGFLLSVDQLGIDPAPATPDGWHEFEAGLVGECQFGTSADLMPFGREDFHGWGGREVIAERAASASFILHQPSAGPPANVIQIRGLAADGEWTAQVDRSELQPLATPADAKEPSVWPLKLAQPHESPGVALLTLRCNSKTGRLLLDAWRLGESE